MKIGITERGDAALDFSWIPKLAGVDGAVLITKNISDPFIEAALKYQHKIIVHATCTGYGGTVIEPNVPTPNVQIAQVKKLISAGFPAVKTVLRVDPIIPTRKGIATAEKVLIAAPDEVRRVRFSIIDMYQHVFKRFIAAGLKTPFAQFTAPQMSMEMVDEMLGRYTNRFCLESCAESGFKNANATGCISDADLTLLGLDPTNQKTEHRQRPACQCLACKTELLSNAEPCEHGCLYCYWKDRG